MRTNLFILTVIICLFTQGLGLAQSLVPIDPGSVSDGHVYLLEDETDSSTNGNTGTIVGAPTVVDGLSGMAMQFDGVADGLTIPNAATINLSTHQNKTIIAVFKCADVDKAEKQVVFEEGGTTRGMNIYVHEGQAYAGGWNPADYTPQWPGTWFSAPIGSDEWHVVAGVLREGGAGMEDDKFEVWIDGTLVGVGPGAELRSRSNNCAIGYFNSQTKFHDGNGTGGGGYFEGVIDELWILNEALTPEELSGLGLNQAIAKNPAPADEAVDVARDLVINWTPGEFAAKHNVYLGTTFTDVNEAAAGTLIAENLDVNSIDPGRLDFGVTYYLRVDEVNSAPDFTVHAGDVWSFTVEPHGRPITNVTATASSSQAADMGPENTVGGVGLNELDQHSTEATDMWLSGMGDPAPQIQYDFDKVYKLDAMLVWNSNQLVESFVGLGAKDVVVETSADGAEWTVLDGATLFNQATGSPTYTANTSIDFGGILAQSVRITINAGYGFLPQYGLSEVQILYVPTFAREPQPASGSVMESANVELAWRSGRESASSEVYLGTDAADLPLLGTTTENSMSASGLNYSTTYFWSVTEVNEAEAITSHAGDVWSFTTPDYGIVDSFDQYDDNCNRIFFAWEDGLGHNGGEEIDGCDVPASNGNGGGSIVGNDTAPFAEKTIVNAGSTQSLPFNYDNAFGPSEATVTLEGQDWSVSGILTLSLYFRGETGNTGSLYLKINNTKVTYEGSSGGIGRPAWQAWNIELASTGASLGNVNSLTIGVDGGSAAGMLYVDDIRLYPVIFEAGLTDITSPGDTVQGVPNDDDWPAAESPANAIDDIVRLGGASSKYLHRKGGSMATGFQVEPIVGATVVTGLALTTANDVPTRDPITFELYGSNASIDGPYELIAAGDVIDFAGATEWPRYTPNATAIEFENTTAYGYYQILFPTLRGAAETLMQIAEVELLGTIQ
jgi:hypothetical protein